MVAILTPKQHALSSYAVLADDRFERGDVHHRVHDVPDKEETCARRGLDDKLLIGVRQKLLIGVRQDKSHPHTQQILSVPLKGAGH